MSLRKKESDTKGIKAILIFEIIGKPPEHLVQALEELIKKIDEEGGISVKEKKINEPVPMQENKEFYTTFAEVEVESESIMHLASLMFRYMPAHVEVIEPELIVLANNGWTEILSELTRRLHGYDEVARVLQLQNAQMQNKLRELLPEEKSDKEEKKKINEEYKSAAIEAGNKMEKARAREEKHSTKLTSPKQEKNNRKEYTQQSRGH